MVHQTKWIHHSDQSESFQVNLRSEDPFFFPVVFFLLYVYEMLARTTLGRFSIENVLKLYAPFTVQQFIIIVRNVSS